MASFFEKLKKGMGVEEPIMNEEEVEEDKSSSSPFAAARVKETAETTGEENKSPSSPTEASAKVEKKEPSSTSSRKRGSVKEDKVPELKTELLFMGAKVKKRAEPSSPIKKLEIQNRASITEGSEGEEQAEKEPKEQKEKKWPFFGKEEGQLAIDVYQTENDLVIQSAIAGVRPENLDILMERDIITIKGSREKPSEENGDYFTQECFWGPFSREVILPAEVDPGRAIAEMKNGILTIRIPRILREKKKKIIIKG